MKNNSKYKAFLCFRYLPYRVQPRQFQGSFLREGCIADDGEFWFLGLPFLLLLCFGFGGDRGLPRLILPRVFRQAYTFPGNALVATLRISAGGGCSPETIILPAD